jgi:hypothetical protein
MTTRAQEPAPEAQIFDVQPGRDCELGALARRELLSFAAEHVGMLPVPVRIWLRASGPNVPVSLVTCELAPRTFALADEVTFDAEEIRALAIGAQSERCRPADFKTFCLRKLVDSSFRVTEEVALDGAEPERVAAWSLDRMLRWLELEPAEVEYMPLRSAISGNAAHRHCRAA